MSFRLINAPAIFQAFINNVLRKYLDVFIIMYLDDILIYSQTEEDHERHVKKSVFHVYEVKYLGYIIVESGIKMDLVKINMIKG